MTPRPHRSARSSPSMGGRARAEHAFPNCARYWKFRGRALGGRQLTRSSCRAVAAYPWPAFDVVVLRWRACPFVVVAVPGLVAPAPIADRDARCGRARG